MPVFVQLFILSSAATAVLFSLALVERAAGRRLILGHFRVGIDAHIIRAADGFLKMLHSAHDHFLSFFARVVRSAAAEFIFRSRKLSARLRDAAERRRAVSRNRGSVSLFLRTIAAHKQHLGSERTLEASRK